MKRNRYGIFILLSLAMTVFACSHSAQEDQKEMSLTMSGFRTTTKKPFVYLDETTNAIPVTISFEKGEGELEIDEFSLTSTKPISIFKDLNKNQILDKEEESTLVELSTSPTPIKWIGDDGLNADYVLYSEHGFSDNTIVSYGDYAKGIALEEYCKGNEVIAERHSPKNGPSSIALVYDNPKEHIEIIQDTSKDVFYKSDFQIKSDDVFKILEVDGATSTGEDTYHYEGLDGEIAIHYALNIKDEYYLNKTAIFGENAFKHTLSLKEHDHSVGSPHKDRGMIISSCDCDVFDIYELDTVNANDSIEPDLNNPDQMMGNQMFLVDWDVTGILKGRYKVYVQGSTQDKQKDLNWLTHESETITHCPSYIRIGEKEYSPCTEKTFGETFGLGSNWRWTSSYIFDVEIPDGLKTLSLNSGNNNGRLNEYNMFIRSLLLVPYSSDITPATL
ncbi:MAG: hypothetical protein MJ238_05225 [Bacilli bacterium]|nr:hypothetical protein [Bacilli bacterium]